MLKSVNHGEHFQLVLSATVIKNVSTKQYSFNNQVFIVFTDNVYSVFSFYNGHFDLLNTGCYSYVIISTFVLSYKSKCWL